MNSALIVEIIKSLHAFHFQPAALQRQWFPGWMWSWQQRKRDLENRSSLENQSASSSSSQPIKSGDRRSSELSSVRWFIIKKTMRAPKLESSQLGRPTIIAPAPDPPTDKIGADADEQRRYVLPSFLPCSISRVPTPFRRSPAAAAHAYTTHPTNPTSTSFFWFGCLHQSLRSLGKEEKLKRGTPNEIRVRVPIAEHRRPMNMPTSCEMDSFV